MGANKLKVDEKVMGNMPKSTLSVIEKFCEMNVKKVNLNSKIKNISVEEDVVDALLFMSETSGVDVGTIINEAVVNSGVVKAYQDARDIIERDKNKEDKTEEASDVENVKSDKETATV